MRILIINSFYYPNIVGGTESVIKLLSEELVREGEDVAVYTGDCKGDSLTHDMINGVEVYRGVKAKFQMNPKDGKKNSLLIKIDNNIKHIYNIKIKTEIDYVINRFHPDVIHTHNLSGFSTNVWRYASNQNIPVVHTAHDYWLLEKKIHFGIKRNSSYVSYITAPSEKTLNTILKSGLFVEAHSSVVQNGLPLNINALESVIQERMERSEIPVRFLYVGQLIEKKGLSKLLEALQKYKYENIEVHICGKGILKEKVEEAAAQDKRIVFHGFLNESNLSDVYDQCDVLIAPSIWDEPFGMVAVEAYCHGLTVIAGNRGGLKDIVQGVGAGITVEPEVKEIIQGIDYYCDRQNIKEDLRKIKSVNQYGIDIQASHYKKIYCDVLNKRV